MKFRQAMPSDDRQNVVAISTDSNPDLIPAGATQGSDQKLEGASDSPPGWSSLSISKWDQDKPADSRSEKIRLWRRRALSKRGARLHTKMSADGQSSSLAMLDETGVVVCWYGSLDGRDYTSEEVVDRHLSQFYVSEDVGKRQPYRDLRAAVVNGRITRRGWRRRRDGSAFLGFFDIQPVVLRDGRVQGFSYLASAPA
ncbi:hypothetical protein GCM10011487_22500 [Steroidobacter agaridevorans]|uniref:PAS domain-containing protein n=1 Tax=Steroidobacter agaridevorans TaxID=2695856 RepID=A0A829YAN9_9GAMM|nr:hypothetical protein [Steroidobacter agaridevorans]GFE80250.1 hypothetical protein GCM10011487_22500 [Steroidobacter agaridevorans]